jgi:diguanylate cyclase (GGDEF)-like protein/PAS domain S-box-containing protein
MTGGCARRTELCSSENSLFGISLAAMTFAARTVLLRPAAIGLCYFLLASATIATTRFGNGFAFIWVATALLIAELWRLKSDRWWPTILACMIGSFAATSLFGYGPWGAGPLAVINCAEAIIAATLMRRLHPDDSWMGSLRGISIFILAAGVLAPMLTSIGAMAFAMGFGQPALPAAARWFTGHALGALTFAPILKMVVSGKVSRILMTAPAERLIEGFGLLIIVSATAAFVFGQSALPLLFLPFLPAIAATLRLGRFGAAGSILILTLVGFWFTVRGSGPMVFPGASPGAQLQLLQFYLAVMALTILPVAADLSRRARLARELRESEARYRLLSDHTTDVVLSLSRGGRIKFVSRSALALTGHDAEALIDRNPMRLIDPADRPAATAAYAQALADPGSSPIVEFRGLCADRSRRWMELHMQGVFDDGGRADGVVMVIRDISHRKRLEAELRREADTDGLTGLLNRRAFMKRLDAAIETGEPACLALFDLDRFKQVNDRHGHATGDEVLRQFAQCARGVLRDGEGIGRLGGEEFAVLLTGAGWAQGRAICDRVRAHMAALRIAALDGESITVTVSAGLALLRPGLSREDLMLLADEALYRAKSAGRNQLAEAA